MLFAQGRRVLVTLAAFAISAFGQDTKVELTGKVTEPATGLGIPGAQVTLSLGNQGEGKKLICNQDGKFEITLEAPGNWMAVAEADGYKDILPTNMRLVYGVTVKPGSNASQILNLTLTRAAQLSGRLIDHTTKAPLAGFPVAALKVDWTRGRQTLNIYGKATTRADGRFELKDVPPGEIILETREPGKEEFLATKQPDYTEKSPRTTGYPRTQWPEQAPQGNLHGTLVAPGATIDFGKIELERQPMLRIRALIRAPHCEPEQSVLVTLRRVDEEFPTVLASGSAACNSTITFTGLAPINYGLSARIAGQPAFERLFAEIPVALATDLDTALTLQPDRPLDGTVILDGSEFHAERIPNLKFALSSQPLFASQEQTRPDSTGAFRLPLLPRKEFELLVTGLEDPYVVTELIYNGSKLAGMSFNPQPADQHKIEVKIAPVAATLTGIVRQDDKPVQGARLFVAPWPIIYANGYPTFQEVESAEDGSYRAERLRPGKYHVIAVAPSARPRFERTEELLSALKSADEVELGPRATQVLNLNQLLY